MFAVPPPVRRVSPGYRAPLLLGDAGTAQTIALMRQLVDQALQDPAFIRTATDIVRSVPAFDEVGEVQAIYHWVLANIRYTKDPVSKEKLYPPAELLKIRAGDCDDIAMLLAALLLAVGYTARLVTIAASSGNPDEFSHVYVEAEVPAGSDNWIALDAARPDATFGLEPPVYTRKRAWSLVDDSYQDIGRLGAYMGLGDDGSTPSWVPILQTAIQQIPQDIALAQGNPYAYSGAQLYSVPGGYALQTQTSPWLWIGGALLLGLVLMRSR